MNKFVKRELERCRVPLPDWNESTTCMVIPSMNKQPETKINKNQVTISIKNYIINEPSNFTLSASWNNGTKPPERTMVVDIVDNRGKMIKVEGKGVTTGKSWVGWLPQKGFDIV